MSTQHIALHLFQNLFARQGQNQNIIFSPYSLQQALQMLYDGTTDVAIQEALASDIVPPTEHFRNTRTGELLLLYSKDRSINSKECRDDVRIVHSASEGLREKENFQRHILGSVLDRSQPREGLNLCTALHYLARWDMPFPRKDTQQRPFTLGTGEKIYVETMKSELNGIHGAIHSQYDIATLTAAQNSAQVCFIKPKGDVNWVKENLEKILPPFDSANETYRGFGRTSSLKTILEMPKLSLQKAMDMTNLLETNYPCLQDGFALPKFVQNPSYIWNLKGAKQCAELIVNEESAEAKVYTQVRMCLTIGVVIEPIHIHIKMDSPYFLVIRDTTRSGESRIVLTAWIADPRH